MRFSSSHDDIPVHSRTDGYSFDEMKTASLEQRAQMIADSKSVLKSLTAESLKAASIIKQPYAADPQNFMRYQIQINPTRAMSMVLPAGLNRVGVLTQIPKLIEAMTNELKAQQIKLDQDLRARHDFEIVSLDSESGRQQRPRAWSDPSHAASPDLQIQAWHFQIDGKSENTAKIRKFVIDALQRGEILDGRILKKSSSGTIYSIKPVLMEIERGGVRMTAIWRTGFGVIENVESNLASQTLDNHLESMLVPFTAERMFNGVRGSIQYWMNGLDSSGNLNSVAWFRALQGHFDAKAENESGLGGISVLWDNGSAFSEDFQISEGSVDRFNRIFEHAVVLAENGNLSALSAILPNHVVFKKLLATTDEQWLELFKGQLNMTQVYAFMNRKDAVVGQIKKAVIQFGEEILAS